jgi:zinc protease
MPPVCRPSFTSFLLCVLLFSGFTTAVAQKKQAVAKRVSTPPEVRLPSRVIRLENGLTLVMHQDLSMPWAGVEVLIRGGAREELPGQFGVAHLFEHEASYPNKFLGNPENLVRFRQAGRGGGAGAEPDFLRFYTVVTPDGLELALGALADRLQLHPERYTAERLQRDKDIVISELRRSMGVDWNTEVRAHLHRGTFGSDHPYGHSVGGAETDVRAATVELMQDWHRRFAGASNTVLLIAGNFDPAQAETMARRHFGTLEPGQTPARLTEWVPPARALREVLEIESPHGVAYLRWPVSSWGSADGDYLSLLARVLARRVQRRADAEATLDNAAAQVELWEIAGAFTLKGDFNDPASASTVETILRTELEGVLRAGISADELERARAEMQTEFVHNLQQPAWRNGRTDVLGQGLLFRGNAEHYRTQLARINNATPLDIRDAGRRWLASPGYVLHVLPRPARKAIGTIDRAATISVPEPEPPAFPAIQRATLPNGLRLIVSERPQLPLVRLTFALDAGSGTDDPTTAGRARVALNALKRMPVSPDGTTLSDALAAVGATLEAELDRDYALLSVSVLSDRVDAAIRLIASALTHGLTPQVFQAARLEASESLEAALKNPIRARERVLACMLDGDASCHAGAVDGLGTRAGLERLSAEDMRRFYATHYRPTSALLAASGDVNRQRLTTLLGAWASSTGVERQREQARPAGATTGGFTIVDYPGATQSYVLLAQRLPPAVAADPLLAEVLTMLLRTRLMNNLRTAKGWSYEVYPFGVELDRRSAAMRFNIPLQTDKTAEAIAEIREEIRRLRDEPVSKEMLAGPKSFTESNKITGALTSLALMNAQLVALDRNNLPTDYYTQSLGRLSAITPEDVTKASRAMLDPERFIWVIAGERSALERELGELGLRNVRVVSQGEAP